MKYTGNLKLLKPDDNDIYDIEHANTNMDILDRTLTEFNGKKGEIIHLKNIDIFSANWKLENGNYVYVYKNDKINDKTSVNVYFHLSSLYNARYIHSVTESSTGQVKLFARIKPTDNLKCDMTLLREGI